MNKIERVEGVLHGKDVDYPPISLWYHFGVQHGGGEQFARITLEYFQRYDFDFLKVMNDYYYPTPKGLDAVRTKADLQKFTTFDVERCEWREQFKALRIISRELKGRAYFIDTVFDPWQSIRRSVAGENMELLVKDEPDALHAAPRVQQSAEGLSRLLDRGADPFVVGGHHPSYQPEIVRDIRLEWGVMWDGEAAFLELLAKKMSLGSDAVKDVGNLYSAALPAWIAAGLEEAERRGLELEGAPMIAVGYEAASPDILDDETKAKELRPRARKPSTRCGRALRPRGRSSDRSRSCAST